MVHSDGVRQIEAMAITDDNLPYADAGSRSLHAIRSPELKENCPALCSLCAKCQKIKKYQNCKNDVYQPDEKGCIHKQSFLIPFVHYE